MKKLLFLMFALMLMSNSDCSDHVTYETDEQVYLVLDKGSQVGSHFNLFHKDYFEVSTDYYITFQNVNTKHTFVYTTRSGEEYYMYQKGKRYRHTRFRNDYKY